MNSVSGTARQRDLQRNSAYFLGAAGTAFGVLGGGMSSFGLVAWLAPEFAQTAPDWFVALFLIGIMVAFIGAWPALDWLLNRRPTIGGPVLAVIGALLILEGTVTVVSTGWGFVGWFAILGGLLLLPAAHLAVAGGGTEPLTWRSLRTPRVQQVEARADLAVSGIVGVVSLLGLAALIVGAVLSGDTLTSAILGVVALGAAGWLVWRRLAA